MSTENEVTSDGANETEGDQTANTNSLTTLQNHHRDIKENIKLIGEKSLQQCFDNGLLMQLKETSEECEAILSASCQNILEIGTEIETLKETLCEAVTVSHNKLQEEFALDEGQEISRPEDEGELEKMMMKVKMYTQTTEAAESMSKVADLGEQTKTLFRKVLEYAVNATKVANEYKQHVETAREMAKQQQETEEREKREQKQVEEKLAEEKRKEKEEIEKEQERKRLEEEERRQRAEEKNSQNDPRKWPVFEYLMEGENRERTGESEAPEEGKGILCLVRAFPDELQKDQLQCQGLNQTDLCLTLQESEELASDAIKVSSNKDNLTFSHGIWLSIPHTAPRGIPSKELVTMMTKDGSTWTEVKSRDITLPEYKDIRLAEVFLKSVNSVTFVAISRIKTDRESFDKRGGRLTSSVDHKIGVTVPKATFSFRTEIALKVLPVDTSVLTDMQYRYEHTSLMATSGFIFLKCGGKCNKELLLNMLNPGQKRAGKVNNESKLNTPRSSQTDPDAGGYLYMAMKADDGRWKYNEQFQYTVDKDMISFTVNENIHRLVILRMECVTSADKLMRTVRDLETCIAEKKMCCLLRQRSRDMTQCYVELCNANPDKIEEASAHLSKLGYDDGPKPADNLIITECQTLEVTFRGNVTFGDIIIGDETIEDTRGKFAMIYNSNRRSAHKDFSVKVVDRYAQHGLDTYRGHLQLWKIHSGSHLKNPDKEKAMITAPGQSSVLLCELPITLPKNAVQNTSVIRAPITLKFESPLSEEFIKELSEHLEDEWLSLAEALGMKKPRIQSIMRNNQDNALDICIRDMLLDWYKTTSRNLDKVKMLMNCLIEVGRDDLATRLEDD